MAVKGLKVTSDNGDLHDWLELPDTYTKKYFQLTKKTLQQLLSWSSGSTKRVLLEKLIKKKTSLLGYWLEKIVQKFWNQLTSYQVKMMDHMGLRPNLAGALGVLLMVLAEQKYAAIG